MSTKSEATKASFPIIGVLGLIFITLKLAGIGAVAEWSWWWVLSPFWIPFALAGVIFAGWLLLVVIARLITR